MVADELEISVSEMSSTSRFRDLGLDSLVELSINESKVLSQG